MPPNSLVFQVEHELPSFLHSADGLEDSVQLLFVLGAQHCVGLLPLHHIGNGCLASSDLIACSRAVSLVALQIAKALPEHGVLR
ncbi:MAG TPA: hypothetical protein DCF63_12435 [Planctomycetaceae bacterium]|nr:hypothetical protein [Planctomycetaceae bacterium]